eukprot:217443_1
MSTEQKDNSTLGWRSSPGNYGTLLAKKLYLVCVAGIGTYLNHLYLYEKRNDLCNDQKKVFSWINYIIYGRFTLTKLYTNSTRPVQTSDMIAMPIVFPLLMALPIYLTSKKETFEWNTYNKICGGLYLLGSFISSFSELQRKWFKQNPKNKGKLYT